jgi:hypothetical protein
MSPEARFNTKAKLPSGVTVMKPGSAPTAVTASILRRATGGVAGEHRLCNLWHVVRKNYDNGIAALTGDEQLTAVLLVAKVVRSHGERKFNDHLRVLVHHAQVVGRDVSGQHTFSVETEQYCA